MGTPRVTAAELAAAIEVGRPGRAPLRRDAGLPAQQTSLLEETGSATSEIGSACHVTPTAAQYDPRSPAPVRDGTASGASLSFVVPGEPRGKGRPRFQLRKGRDGQNFIHKHTDDRTLSYEAKIGHLGGLAMAGRQPFERGTPLRCTVLATYAIAASWSKKKQAAALAQAIRPTKKPDGDNILKTVGDALNSVAWADDVDVVEWVLVKVYGTTPSLRITIKQVEVPA